MEKINKHISIITNKNQIKYQIEFSDEIEMRGIISRIKIKIITCSKSFIFQFKS